MKKRSLLVTCLLFSLSAHLLFLFFFARTPFYVHNRLASLFRKSVPATELLTAEEEDLVREKELEEAFEQIVTAGPPPFDLYYQPSSHLKPPAQEGMAALPSLSEDKEAVLLPKEEVLSALKAPLLSAPAHEEVPFEEITILDSPLASQVKLDKQASADHKKALVSASLALDEIESIDDLGLNSLVPSAALESKAPSVSVLESFTASPEKELAPPSSLEGQELSTPPLEESNALIFASPSLSSDLQKPFQFQKPASLPKVSDYLLPDVASSLPWDRAFDVKVELMANPDGDGVVFSLNLSPTGEIDVPSMTHNFYFLIDRSSSIQRHRFAAYKRAVMKALSCLQEGDRFNILLFDNKIKRLSERPLPFSKATLRRAEEFLQPQEQGGVFSAGDLYEALEKITPSNIAEGEVHSAILITDGDSSHSAAKQQKQISKWLSKHAGKVAVYTAAVGKANNLVMLDLLSSASGGYLLYSDTYAAFPRKLGKLLLDLHGPLVKDLVVSAQPKKGSSSIEFHPASSPLPTLFAKHPYEIFGRAADLGDFTLLIQGRYKDQWVTITKEVSLKEATKGARLLQKKWANVKAKTLYDNFLKEGKVAHLLKAKELLQASGHEIAAQ